MKLVSVSEMQAIEKEADASGLSYAEMMENAGRGLARVVADEYSDLKEEGVLGLVGSGNNGGDTLVALAALAEQGWMTTAYLVRPRPARDPLVKRVEQLGGKVHTLKADPDFEQLDVLLETHAVILDGVLGTGIRLPLKPEVAGVLDHIRRMVGEMVNPPQVVAVDCPSGVDSDSGEAAAETIPADLTVTMAAVKRGLLQFPAHQLVGDLQVVGIGLERVEPELKSWQAVRTRVAGDELVRSWLPQRPASAHKGSFGTALIVAGSRSYTGAALLSGQAAYRVGAGLVTQAVPESLHLALAGHFPEATWVLLPEEGGVISAAAAPVLRENLARATAVLLGPGFGVLETTAEFMADLLGTDLHPARSEAEAQAVQLPPMVIDADGLKLLTRVPEWPRRLPAPAVLTPHPGEMSILTGLTTAEIQADRIGIAGKFSREWGHVVVLKGAFTVVASPDGETVVIPVATPALARAGTGDVLAGMITGLRAQGLDAFQAAVAGAYLHAQAGLLAEIYLGNPASVLAGDVLRAVPDVLSQIAGEGAL